MTVHSTDTLATALLAAPSGHPTRLPRPDAAPDAGTARAAGLEARPRQEHSLREETQVLATAVLAGAMDAIVVIDADSVNRQWNPAAEHMLGWSAAQAIGRPLAELMIPADQRAAHHSALAQHLLDGSTRILGERVRTEALRSDGTSIPVELTVTSCGTTARPMFAGYVRDLSSENSLRDERDRAAELFQAVVEESPAGTYLTSMDRREITYVSPQLDEWFGSRPGPRNGTRGSRSSTLRTVRGCASRWRRVTR